MGKKQQTSKYHILEDSSKADFVAMLQDFVEIDGYLPVWETYRHNILTDEHGHAQNIVYSILLKKDDVL